MEWKSAEDAPISYEYKNMEWTGTTWLDLKTRETVYSESNMTFGLHMDMGIKIVAPSEVDIVLELVRDDEADDARDEEESPETEE